jgi:hypothetical protein
MTHDMSQRYSFSRLQERNVTYFNTTYQVATFKPATLSIDDGFYLWNTPEDSAISDRLSTLMQSIPVIPTSARIGRIWMLSNSFATHERKSERTVFL